MKYLFFLLFTLMIWSCAKVADIGSVRIVGSNTEVNDISELADGQTVLLQKKKFYILKNASIGNLGFSEFVAKDSLEIEKIIGNVDTLILQSSEGLGLYFPTKKQYVGLKNYSFTKCDPIAKLDSFVVVASGMNACNLNTPSSLSVFAINKKTELVYLSKQNSVNYIQLAGFKRKVIALNSSGNIEVFEIKGDYTLNKINELTGIGATEFKVFSDLAKILITTPAGVIQYKIGTDFGLTKINQISIGSI